MPARLVGNPPANAVHEDRPNTPLRSETSWLNRLCRQDIYPCPTSICSRGWSQLDSPVLKYNPNDVKIGGGRLNTHKISVVWASGASLLVSPMSVEIPSDGMASLNFMRPQDFPDYEKDRKFSASFEGGVPTPVEKFVVSPNQDKDLFASLNRNVSCAIGSLIVSLDTRCP